MRFTSTLPEVRDLDDTFYCRARRKVLCLERCLDDYLQANAFDVKRAACFHCPQGRKNRERFSAGKDPES